MAGYSLVELGGVALIAVVIAGALRQADIPSSVLEPTRFIVRFQEYREQIYYEKYVTERLYSTPCDGRVRWVARNNLAKKYPTDFGVLESVDGAVDERFILVRCVWRRHWHVSCYYEYVCAE